jgi:hypothetical protein
MKISDVVVLDEVSHDLTDGKLFYDESEMGIGTYFQDSVIADIESLFIYAGVHSKVFGFHRMPAKRFPYAIYYHVHNEVAIVVAVLPMRRNPHWVKDKLNKRS